MTPARRTTDAPLMISQTALSSPTPTSSSRQSTRSRSPLDEVAAAVDQVVPVYPRTEAYRDYGRGLASALQIRRSPPLVANMVSEINTRLADLSLPAPRMPQTETGGYSDRGPPREAASLRRSPPAVDVSRFSTPPARPSNSSPSRLQRKEYVDSSTQTFPDATYPDPRQEGYRGDDIHRPNEDRSMPQAPSTGPAHISPTLHAELQKLVARINDETDRLVDTEQKMWDKIKELLDGEPRE